MPASHSSFRSSSTAESGPSYMHDSVYSAHSAASDGYSRGNVDPLAIYHDHALASDPDLEVSIACDDDLLDILRHGAGDERSQSHMPEWLQKRARAFGLPLTPRPISVGLWDSQSTYSFESPTSEFDTRSECFPVGYGESAGSQGADSGTSCDGTTAHESLFTSATSSQLSHSTAPSSIVSVSQQSQNMSQRATKKSAELSESTYSTIH